jgi:hypothetical protein
MLIASMNQIAANGGYVNNWTTADYGAYLKAMKEKYPNSNVLSCRDHCGPGFNGNHDLADTYANIEADIANGFDLIHIDFCHFKGTKQENFEESKKAIEHCKKLNPNIMLEVGTDENVGANFTVNDLETLEEELDFFASVCKPEFYVVQTGSLILEMNQVGNFNEQWSQRSAELLRSKGVKFKEHNADYLPKDEIQKRKGIVDAMNIAPQLGVIQTQLVLNKCLIYGIPFDAYIEKVYASGKWKKWLNKNTPENKFLCAVVAGHYLFGSEEYKAIISQLKAREDIHETIVNTIMEVIDHYERT